MDFSSFDIIWVEGCSYLSGAGVPKHKHAFFHFIYVDSGEGKIVIDKVKYSMLPANIYLIPPFIRHEFINNCKNPLKTFEIKFSLNSEDGIIKELPYCMNVKNYPIKAVLQTILKEASDKMPMFRNVINSNFQLLLSYLMRCNEEYGDNAVCDNKKKESFPEIDKVIDYIYENLANEITLDNLAEIAGFEKNYFTRKFKRQTNCTPIIFVREKRIEKAKELLRYSDMNISQIALATGFKTVHYLSEVFMECMGERPSEYRDKNKVYQEILTQVSEYNKGKGRK